MSKIITTAIVREKLKETPDVVYIRKLQSFLDKEITFEDFLTLGRVEDDLLVFPCGAFVQADTSEKIKRTLWNEIFKDNYNETEQEGNDRSTI